MPWGVDLRKFESARGDISSIKVQEDYLEETSSKLRTEKWRVVTRLWEGWERQLVLDGSKWPVCERTGTLSTCGELTWAKLCAKIMTRINPTDLHDSRRRSYELWYQFYRRRKWDMTRLKRLCNLSKVTQLESGRLFEQNSHKPIPETRFFFLPLFYSVSTEKNQNLFRTISCFFISSNNVVKFWFLKNTFVSPLWWPSG